MAPRDDSELRRALDAGVSFLAERSAEQVAHSSGSFLDHLAGVADLLVAWDCPADTCLAGLFHAVYGTEAFPRPLVDASTEAGRAGVRAVIGEPAEQLSWLFERVDRQAFFAAVDADPPRVVDRTSGEHLAVSRAEHRALCDVLVANWLEQLPGSPQKCAGAVVAQYRLLVPHLDPLAAAAVLAVPKPSRAHDVVATARRRLRRGVSRR
jgi:hypothetical protein